MQAFLEALCARFVNLGTVLAPLASLGSDDRLLSTCQIMISETANSRLRSVPRVKSLNPTSKPPLSPPPRAEGRPEVPSKNAKSEPAQIQVGLFPDAPGAAVCGAAAARAGLKAEPGRHGRTGRPGSDSDGTRAVPPVGRSLM